MFYILKGVSADFYVEKMGSNLVGSAKDPYLKALKCGWHIDLDVLLDNLNKLSSRYPHTPLMIVENSFGATDRVEEDGSIHDSYRIDYFRQHIQAMNKAIDNGVDLMVYTSRGPIDIVLAGTDDFFRRKKDSFYWYKKVCESNGQIVE